MKLKSCLCQIFWDTAPPVATDVSLVEPSLFICLQRFKPDLFSFSAFLPILFTIYDLSKHFPDYFKVSITSFRSY